MRDDFSEKTKETLAKRVAMRCSNPGCPKPTSGPRDDPDKALNIGVAAHITAACPGGPRYDASLSASERCSIKNAIWLCQNCAKLVDSDVERFTVEVLREWKKAAEDAARHRIETNEDEQQRPQTLRRESVRPYATVARPKRECSILLREHLYREDFEDRSVICPVAWDDVAQALARQAVVAVQGPPGSGKSTLAAWMDWKLSQRTHVEYLPGRSFQHSQEKALVEALDSLPNETVVLIDDAHLVQRHLDQLMRASIAPKMRFLLISRPGGFANIPGIPQPIDLSAAAKSTAQTLASQYTSTPDEASSVLSESQGDLVFTKWLLGAMQQYPSQRNPTLDATVITKLKQFWDIDRELLRLLLVVSAYRWLELPCSIETLTEAFGFGSETIEVLTEGMREATVDCCANSLNLDRHPKLAGLFEKTASKFQYYTVDVLKPTCAAFHIDHSIVAGALFGNVVLGLAFGCGAVRASDIVDRLLFSSLHSDCAEFCKTAACIESKLNPVVNGLDTRTVERRLTIAFAAYDAMRRVRDEEQAWKLLIELREHLGVTGNPAMAFERKGYLLYQVGFHYLLINQLAEALNHLRDSAEADEQWAKQHNAKLHFGKAAMSRIAAARAAADVLLSTGNGAEDPKPDMQQLAGLAGKLDAERVLLEGLIPNAAGMDWSWLQRWYLNALLHLAELRACLGDHASVETLTRTATAVGTAIGLETSTRQSVKLAHGSLAFHQRDFHGVVDLLEDIPAKQQKAGERSGRFAQLLAIAYRELGNLQEYNRWCRWLVSECASDKANGPAVTWAKAVLRKDDAKP